MDNVKFGDDVRFDRDADMIEKKIQEIEEDINKLENDLPGNLDATHLLKLGSKLNNEMEYLKTLSTVLNEGDERNDRTGVGTIGMFGLQNTYSLDDGFPLLTTKKIHFKSIVHELLWMLSGSTNVKYLKDNGVKIWDEWADENGELGPVYGKQWRDFNGKDQLLGSIQQIKENPMSRRIITSFWNPAEIDSMKLPPCHMMHQFYVGTDGTLSMQMYQRSCDLFLGVPFNIASYALLLSMIAQVTDLVPGKLIHNMGDAHIYSNHIAQVELQLTRPPRIGPVLRLNPAIKNILDFKYEDIVLENYNPFPSIKGDVAV